MIRLKKLTVDLCRLLPIANFLRFQITNEELRALKEGIVTTAVKTDFFKVALHVKEKYGFLRCA